MIIEMAELNPFDEDKPFAMTDAAKDSQFTIKTADDYTRADLDLMAEAGDSMKILLTL